MSNDVGTQETGSVWAGGGDTVLVSEGVLGKVAYIAKV